MAASNSKVVARMAASNSKVVARMAASNNLGYLEAMRVSLWLSCIWWSCSAAVQAEPLTIAVASNFRVAAEAIAAEFGATTGHDVRISSASTGKLYAQIVNGAPFDVLLAADSRHPRLLEEAGIAAAGTRSTYATGSLVLWSRSETFDEIDCRASLETPGKLRIAIANPETAPYGAVAKQFLLAAGLWDRIEPQIVYGENIGQALHFVVTGNAQLGLIARSQAQDARIPAATCYWPVPAHLHAPIDQQAVVLQRSADNPAARAFVEFLAGSSGAAIVRRYGYEAGE